MKTDSVTGNIDTDSLCGIRGHHILIGLCVLGGIGWWGGVAGKGLWGCGGRRKGGQVRFSAAQTGALERRFATAKYLSPDERRALATSLRLSDRQVKTWYQNRRAKWRRSTTDGDDGSAADSSPASDQDEPGPPGARSPQHVVAVTSH
ncbi:Hematopoietically-expressed homeobox protein hhex [Eumeta japonica]|uniref:Hematopoietically-expressed homeobox protein hhex n=1 Tax=Eumeta variegata TaxID=151549 RepID=A0A4C1YNT6_EUMVA|nr:Hematopoietically-expressed homeobox protein hhex [Eumeta japonica]